MKAGYKQTEVGALPSDWRVMPLGDLLEFRNGANADKEAYGHGTRFINVLEVITNTHLRASDVPGRVSLGEVQQASFQVKPGDILFNRTSETQDEVGLSAVYLDEEPVVFGGFVIRGRPFPESQLDQSYSGYGFRAQAVRRQIIARGQGAIHANIGQTDLRTVALPVPPLPEQRAIAAALSDVDALIGSLDKLIAKKRDLKQGAMQQLLTGATRLPGFGGKWEIAEAGDVGRFRGGNGFPTNAQGADSGSYPFFKVSDMNHPGNETWMSKSNNWIAETIRKQLGATAFPPESIVFAKVGAAVFLERKRLLAQASCIDNNMASFVVDQGRLAPRFAHLVFLGIRFGDLVSTTALPSLNGTVLRQIPLPVPPLPEQHAIVSALSDMDAELAALEQRRDKTKLLKQGMMQELLTGRVRLV